MTLRMALMRGSVLQKHQTSAPAQRLISQRFTECMWSAGWRTSVGLEAVKVAEGSGVGPPSRSSSPGSRSHWRLHRLVWATRSERAKAASGERLSRKRALLATLHDTLSQGAIP